MKDEVRSIFLFGKIQVFPQPNLIFAHVYIPSLVKDDVVITDASQKAECLSSYCMSVFASGVTSNTTATCALDETLPMENILFNIRGIAVLLESLNVSKAAGPDCLLTALLKSCARSASPFLKIIVENSPNDCSLPDDGKPVSVIQVHKSRPRDNVFNYSPISLTCVSCQILEHILYASIMKHMNAH